METNPIQKETVLFRAVHVDAFLKHRERSRSWLARRVGLSPSHLHYLLNGRAPISADYARSMALALDAPEGVLFAPVE